MSTSEQAAKTKGIIYTIAAYIAWGSLPVYWKALKLVPAKEILAHRIIWSFVFVLIILLFNKRWQGLKEVFSEQSKRLGIFFSSLLISSNWFIYIWAVNSDKVVEASLGYYINPLLTVLLGLIILREKLDIWQVISLLLAAAGVVILTLEYGKVPWVALSLALTFALYSLAKKLVKVEATLGLALETVVVVPVALSYLSFLEFDGKGALGQSVLGYIPSYIALLLIGAGIVTALPLLWFAQGAKTVPFTTIGFIQYLSPSISLLLGIFVFKEIFTTAHALSFGFIWCALAVYSLSRLKWMRLWGRKLPKMLHGK